MATSQNRALFLLKCQVAAVTCYYYDFLEGFNVFQV